MPVVNRRSTHVHNSLIGESPPAPVPRSWPYRRDWRSFHADLTKIGEEGAGGGEEGGEGGERGGGGGERGGGGEGGGGRRGGRGRAGQEGAREAGGHGAGTTRGSGVSGRRPRCSPCGPGRPGVTASGRS